MVALKICKLGTCGPKCGSRWLAAMVLMDWRNDPVIGWLTERLNGWMKKGKNGKKEGRKEWRNEGMKEWRNEGMREWGNEGMREWEWRKEGMHGWFERYLIWLMGWWIEGMICWINELMIGLVDWIGCLYDWHRHQVTLSLTGSCLSNVVDENVHIKRYLMKMLRPSADREVVE